MELKAELKTKLRATPHLYVITHNGKALVYDSITGENLVINNDSLEIINLFKNGMNTEEIRSTYEVAGLENFLEILKKKKLFFEHEEIQITGPNVNTNQDKIRDGGLLQHLRLNVTEACNLDCTYCYEKESEVFTKRRKMDWETAKRSIDLYREVLCKHNRKSASIRFFGGEPLLNWPLVRRCIEYIQAGWPATLTVNYTVNTNGTLLDEEIIRFFCDHKVYISLSLDGTETENDKFRKFKNGKGIFDILDKKIVLLAGHKARFGIAVVFYDQNLPHLNKLVDYIRKKQEETGYRISINFSPLARVDRKDMDQLAAADKAALLIKAIKYANESGVRCLGGISHFPFNKLLYGVTGSFCSGAGAEFSIDPEGNIYPCAGLDIKLGNLDTFHEIFDSATYKNITARRTGNLTHCKGCEIEGFCGGGCLADVKHANGDMYGMCQDCDFQRELFKALVKNYIL